MTEIVTCSQCGLTIAESESILFLSVILCRGCMRDVRSGKTMRDKLRPEPTPIPSSGVWTGGNPDKLMWLERYWPLVGSGLLVAWVAVALWLRGCG